MKTIQSRGGGGTLGMLHFEKENENGTHNPANILENQDKIYLLNVKRSFRKTMASTNDKFIDFLQ